jgi:hypothetical protein
VFKNKRIPINWVSKECGFIKPPEKFKFKTNLLD